MLNHNFPFLIGVCIEIKEGMRDYMIQGGRFRREQGSDIGLISKRCSYKHPPYICPHSFTLSTQIDLEQAAEDEDKQVLDELVGLGLRVASQAPA